MKDNLKSVQIDKKIYFEIVNHDQVSSKNHQIYI